MALSRVDFPAPLDPIRPTTSPGRAVKSTESTAVRPPKRTVRLVVDSTLPSALAPHSAGAARASDAGGSTVAFGGGGGRRCSIQRKKLSLHQYAIWMNPP